MREKTRSQNALLPETERATETMRNAYESMYWKQKEWTGKNTGHLPSWEDSSRDAEPRG